MLQRAHRYVEISIVISRHLNGRSITRGLDSLYARQTTATWVYSLQYNKPGCSASQPVSSVAYRAGCQSGPSAPGVSQWIGYVCNITTGLASTVYYSSSNCDPSTVISTYTPTQQCVPGENSTAFMCSYGQYPPSLPANPSLVSTT